MDKQKELNSIEVAYDKDADVLYMSEGTPHEAICQMLDNGIIIRRDPSTKKIVGFTIVDFISNFSKSKPQAIPIQAKFSLLQPA
ncbi:MAG: DUF2283 domain-containing protein [Candidatus Omnitrophica bacterium]|nr:DUF2283 domain-containing protein [Candidatus Omnitrophota bacterium]